MSAGGAVVVDRYISDGRELPVFAKTGPTAAYT